MCREEAKLEVEKHRISRMVQDGKGCARYNPFTSFLEAGD